MVRRVVAEAQATSGIETAEGKMIQAVLDLQEQEVDKIMTPRVDMISVRVDAPASEILSLAMNTRYSRIPVYRNGVDDIVGIVFSKDLLQTIKLKNDEMTPEIDDSWAVLTAEKLMVPTFYIPETMSSW
jgi:putative hemolysin